MKESWALPCFFLCKLLPSWSTSCWRVRETLPLLVPLHHFWSALPTNGEEERRRARYAGYMLERGRPFRRRGATARPGRAPARDDAPAGRWRHRASKGTHRPSCPPLAAERPPCSRGRRGGASPARGRAFRCRSGMRACRLGPYLAGARGDRSGDVAAFVWRRPSRRGPAAARLRHQPRAGHRATGCRAGTVTLPWQRWSLAIDACGSCMDIDRSTARPGSRRREVP